MQVAVYYGNDDVRVEQRDRPVPGPGELLLRVEASGLCGSDVLEWYRKPRAPVVLGHEVAGTVEEVGEGPARFAPGDRIVTTHHVPCNRCRYCLTDRHSVCETLHTTQFDPGGFAEYVRVPAVNVDRGTFLLPDLVSFEEGSFVEPLACAVRGQRLAGFHPGASVIVIGSGASGLLHVQLARALGAGRVFAVDIRPQRLLAARRSGADVALQAGEDLVERLRAGNEGRLAERVIVCTDARSAMEQAWYLVDRGGTVLFFAPLPPDESLEMPANYIWRRCVNVVHSYAGPPADMATALELIATRRVDVASLVTHRVPLADAPRAFDLMLRGDESLKILIEPHPRAADGDDVVPR